MNILNDKKNNLLKRREVQFILESDSNLGYENCKKAAISHFKIPETNVVVKSVKNNFGSKEFVCKVFIYDSEQDKHKIEPKVKAKKKAQSGEKK
ncbi:MAG: 30S ribosomal protein S24e [Nanoarchaeota archaeon]|nr:30S ribosomal protein S24e [Nanoarchaeota archaeon]MBU1051239.1 30S ribosomal protein S24e [Nanoarchaeota archaeon]MBU1988556.1 30S ribosomal protein S24e [Nanoarchaeota archaeon]